MRRVSVPNMDTSSKFFTEPPQKFDGVHRSGCLSQSTESPVDASANVMGYSNTSVNTYNNHACIHYKSEFFHFKWRWST